MHIVPIDQIPAHTTDCPVDKLAEVYDICKQMHAVCKEQNGVGLSAVQVGIPWRLFVIGEGNGPYLNLVNCIYTQDEDKKFEAVEGCLSIKRADGTLRYFKVKRFLNIKVAGYWLIAKGGPPRLEPFQTKVGGESLLNVVFQHEIDHQNGILISEIGEEIEL